MWKRRRKNLEISGVTADTDWQSIKMIASSAFTLIFKKRSVINI